MNNFNYYAPTKVVFGKDTEKETGRLVKEQGASSVLVHFGGKSAIASGLIDRVCQSLKEEGIAYETLGGVVPNPRLSKVREGIALCREKKIDFIEMFKHADELRKIELDIPFNLKLKEALKREHIKLKGCEIDEMVEELWQLHSNH